MNEEILKILLMVKAETISAEEAVELLEAIYKPVETKNEKLSIKDGLTLPWADDNKLYIAAFKGHTHIKNEEAYKDYKFNVEYIGETLNVECCGNLKCEDVKGNVSAGGGVSCGDIGGGLNCGGGVNCGDVDGGVNCGGGANCGDVGANVSCGGSAKCRDIDGDLKAQGSDVTCRDVGGSIEAKTVKCGDVEGNISADSIINK